MLKMMLSPAVEIVISNRIRREIPTISIPLKVFFRLPTFTLAFYHFDFFQTYRSLFNTFSASFILCLSIVCYYMCSVFLLLFVSFRFGSVSSVVCFFFCLPSVRCNFIFRFVCCDLRRSSKTSFAESITMMALNK